MAAGQTSMEACKALGLPAGTVAQWRGDHPHFREQYRQAFENRAFGMAEEAVQVLEKVPRGASIADVTLARAKSDLFKFLAARIVPWLAERHEHHLSGNASISIYLPQKPVLEGTATVVDAGES